jgi:hypothetical protein
MRWMDGQLALTLSLLGAAGGRYTLALSVRNASERSLLVPEPEITGLRFRRVADGTDADWYTGTLQTAKWRGGVLGPGEERPYEFSAVAADAHEPPTDAQVMADDFDLWWVGLRPGEYDVSYRLRVGEDYFDPDSHWRMPQLQARAAELGAEVWTGEERSNGVRVVHSGAEGTSPGARVADLS